MSIPIESRNSFQKYFKYILTRQNFLRKRYNINKKLFQVKSKFYKIKSEEKTKEKEIENIKVKFKLKKNEIPSLKSAFVSPSKNCRNKNLNLLTEKINLTKKENIHELKKNNNRSSTNYRIKS